LSRDDLNRLDSDIISIIRAVSNYGDEMDASAIVRARCIGPGASSRAFRLLVQAGEEGLPAGAIAEKLGMVSSSMSFHLSALPMPDWSPSAVKAVSSSTPPTIQQ
jgi:DNA-binding transcriptional ArsR family regulator